MKIKLIAVCLFFSFSSWGRDFFRNKSVCGLSDERVPSSEGRSGKLVKKITASAGCSASLIGKSCAVSAGHCSAHIRFLQFNQKENGKFASHDTYTVDRKTLDYFSNGPGADYAVFRLNKNAVTGKYPGEAQGFYQVRYSKAPLNEILSVTGFGKDTESSRTFTQQTHEGILENDIGLLLYYKIDTESGNSGSGIILESTDELIGVHTNGGCSAYSGSNSGTSLAGSSKFQAAVKKCLNLDRE